LESAIDFAAVGRVAKVVELKSVRLTEISARCAPLVQGTLVPFVDLKCIPGTLRTSTLEVICDYTFTADAEEVQAVESKIRYLLLYEIAEGVESPAPDDLAEFARANGTLNSWPFVREVLYGLTSRMGYPVYIAINAFQR